MLTPRLRVLLAVDSDETLAIVKRCDSPVLLISTWIPSAAGFHTVTPSAAIVPPTVSTPPTSEIDGNDRSSRCSSTGRKLRIEDIFYSLPAGDPSVGRG
jgi:hypothetical protein